VQVWSQEAFCHCMDQKALMKEVARVLKPGGVIVFSDIMQGDGGGDCTSFTGQNVVASMASPKMYKVRISPAEMSFSFTCSFERS
jgi:sarcosine/dimethylglycine N-methyltransferase